MSRQGLLETCHITSWPIAIGQILLSVYRYSAQLHVIVITSCIMHGHSVAFMFDSDTHVPTSLQLLSVLDC